MVEPVFTSRSVCLQILQPIFFVIIIIQYDLCGASWWLSDKEPTYNAEDAVD